MRDVLYNRVLPAECDWTNIAKPPESLCLRCRVQESSLEIQVSIKFPSCLLLLFHGGKVQRPLWKVGSAWQETSLTRKIPETLPLIVSRSLTHKICLHSQLTNLYSRAFSDGPDCAINCTICWSILQNILQGFSSRNHMMKVCPPLWSKVLSKRHSNAIDLKIQMALARLRPCQLHSEFNCIHVHVWSGCALCISLFHKQMHLPTNSLFSVHLNLTLRPIQTYATQTQARSHTLYSFTVQCSND